MEKLNTQVIGCDTKRRNRETSLHLERRVIDRRFVDLTDMTWKWPDLGHDKFQGHHWISSLCPLHTIRSSLWVLGKLKGLPRDKGKTMDSLWISSGYPLKLGKLSDDFKACVVVKR